MKTNLFKSINLIRRGSGANLFRYAMMVFVLLTLGIGNAWGTGTSYMAVKTEDTGNGLVYMTAKNSNPSNPSLSQYQQRYPSGTGDTEVGSSTGAIQTTFFWAKPTRGHRFKTWGGNWQKQPASSDWGYGTVNDPSLQATWNGEKDLIETTNGGNDPTHVEVIALFDTLAPFTINYLTPVGGSYSVSYSYILSRQKSGTTEYELYETGEDYNLSPNDESIEVGSYRTEKVSLAVPTNTTNFIGWYENGEKISEDKAYTYTVHANASVCPMFKELAWGDVSGDLTTNVTAKGEFGGKTVYVAIPTLIGSWLASDFTVAPETSSNDFGSIAIGTISLDKTTNPNRLVIPYTYTATNWGGVEATFTITPTHGATKQFSVACSAEEIVDYEACIEENEVRTYTGTLAEMMTQANSMNNQPTLKLMNNKTITAPLSFTNSFTFDVNGKVLTANCASAFSIDAAGKDVKIIDGSFTQVGEIHAAQASSGVVSVVTFTQAAKLTMQGGTLSAENTGTGSAYGVNVCNGSIFFMTNGQLTVNGVSEAHGVHVATASDYATLNGGSLTVSAPTQAYGLWSAGQSNITNATINAQTTTTGAYGIYVNGGVSTLEGNTITATAATNNAYGAYVSAAGRLNVNGGSISATAVSSGVYGVHVAAGATAMVQMNAVVTAEATGASGTNVFGVNNLGTVSLTNVSVTANAATNATAVNTATSAVSTSIDGGTYRANTTGGIAYGLHHQYGALDMDGGTFRAVGGENEIYGALVSTDATIANASLWGETTGTGNTAYGVKGDVANKTISLSGCTITGKSNTSNAYAIYSNTNITATGCTLTATTMGTSDAYGFYANAGTNSLTNCNATVSANTVKAYGVNHVAGNMTISGGIYNVEAKQSAVPNVGTPYLYGVYNGSGLTTTISGATFNAVAVNNSKSQYVYGAYINGVLNSSDATYTAQGRAYVYGVYGSSNSELNLTGGAARAQTTNEGNCYGIYAQKTFRIDGNIVVEALAIKKDAYAMYFDANSSIGEVLNGKFSAMGDGTNKFGPLNDAGTVGKVKLKGGVYKTASNLKKYVYTGYDVYTLDDTHPDYAAGYRYIIADKNPSQYVCYIKNGHKYESLKAALQYVKDNSGTYTIIMTQNHTLPAGDYELPKDVTLIIPRNSSQNTLNTNVPKDEEPVVEMLEEHLRLTLATGAHLNVDGKIEVGGKLYSQERGKISYNNSPYGRIQMESGSLIQLNDGAILYAWGFISGTGEIKAKYNSEVHEMFQVGDMQGISELGNHYIDNAYKFFPVQVYSIQNIEVPTTYYYNSRLITSMYEYNPGGTAHGWNGEENIKLIGKEGAMFLVTTNDESSWVRKSYSGGKQIYEVNSSAKLGTLKIKVSSYTMNSANYILPITATMKIHILDGSMEITQSTMFQPGSQVEINKTATLKINDTFEDGNKQTQALKVYVLDQDQWLNSTNPDAAWNVHGNIDVYGSLFTSTTDGANIYSNNLDAGTVSFKSASASAETLTLKKDATTTKSVSVVPANLKNGNGITPAYTPTANTALGEAYIYLNNQWQKTYTNGCFEVIGATVYAKPSEYVALTNTAKDANNKWIGVAESNHTYAAEGGKILILMDECQWWEVEATSDPEVFECKKTGYEGFYYFDNTANKWKLKTVNVKFYSAETGDNVLKTIVTDYNGIPDQAVIASNPTKGTTAEYTYTFYGWKSSVTGTTYKWTDQLEVATDDMSYRPVFTATKRNYTITLNDANNGATVYLEVPYGDTPEYEAKKDATAQYTYSFNGWNPAFAAVSGKATYTAQWTQTKNRYSVTWMNGDDVLETDKNQEYGKLTSYDGATPTKVADNEYVYTFSNWLNSLTGNMRVNNETVTGAITYTAQFSTTPRYMITFANYDGTQLQKEPVTQGETPIYNGVTPARARDLDGYYIFTGWKRNSTGVNYAPNDDLPAATEKETYTAQYSYTNDLFTITLHNVDGNGATWSGKFGEGSTPFYAPDPNYPDVPVIPTKTGNAQYSYTFNGWSLTSGGAKLDPVPAVTGEAEYWALFTQSVNKYDITFANIDGFGALQTIQVEYGSVPVCPVEPKKEEGVKTWAFESWAEGDLVAVTGDATYTAQFSSTYTTRQFDITFDLDNGTQVVVPVTYGETPSWTGETPVKPTDAQYTYTFSGWYPDFEPVTEEASYLALYTETVRSYTVRFVNWDGTELKSSSLNFGATPTPPSNPTRPIDEVNGKKYTFNSWSPALSNVTGDITYTATYTETNVVASVTTSNNNTTFYDSWTGNNGAFNAANTNSAGGCTIKLYSDITESDNTTRSLSKSMTIDLNGHTISARNTNTTKYYIYINGSYTLTIRDSQGGGKIYFEGTGNTNYYTVDVHSSNGVLTVYGGTLEAKNTYNSTSMHAAVAQVYNTNSTVNLYDGKLIASATKGKSYAVKHDGSSYGKVYIYGGKLKAGTDIIGDAAAARNTFSGGYYSKDPGTNVTIATNYEKVAKANDPSDPNWGTDYTCKVVPKKFTLTWNLNGGTVTTAGTAAAVNATGSPSGSVPYTTALTAPVVTKNAYTFSSWSPSVAATMPAAATTYAAQWTPISYNITYTLNGGSATNPATYNIETATFTLNNPTKNGYDFTGWTGSNGSTPQTTVSVTVGSTGDKSYTANWTPTNYSITYDLDGGSVTPANPSGYTIETATFSLNNPTRTGYDFAGWTGSNGSTPQTSVSVNLGSTGNKSFTANWTPRNDTHYTVEHYLQNLDGTYPETPEATVDMQGTTAQSTAAVADDNDYPGFSAPESIPQETIAANGSTVVKIYYERKSYELTWNLVGGKVTEAGTRASVGATGSPSGQVLYGAYITAPTVVRTGCTFSQWDQTVSPMPASDITYTAQYDAAEVLEVSIEEDAISEPTTVVTTIVHSTGTLPLENTLTTTTLILEATSSESGQIAGNNSNLTVTGNAYFDLKLNTPARHWHAFGVPWDVDVTEHPITEVETGRTLVVGRDCEIVYYDGATRASQGAGSHCWKYLKHYNEAGQPIDVMTPGKGYMIAFTSAVQTVRLTKATGADIFFSGTNEVVGGVGKDGGWNAIANPMVYHATLSAGPTVGYVHNGGEIGSDGYDPYDINGTRYIVGKAVYVQAGADQSIVVNPADDAEDMTILAAPKRTKAESVAAKKYLALGDYYAVSLSDGDKSSKVYVLPEEDKADEYVIGHDLSQFSMSSKKPQVWVNRYDTKLALNTTVPVADVADFPISVYAPQANEYTISLASQPSEEYIVYLTQNGEAIWNLSDAPYALSLPAGTNKTYGLRLTARKSPTIATGVDEAVVDAKNEIRKVLIDDKVFIIREGNVYSIDGQLVK